MKFHIDAEGVFHYILGELSYSDFDKSGRVNTWNLIKLIQAARHLRYRGSSRENMNDLGATTFVRSQFLQIYPAFYTSNLTQNHSLELACTLSHLGSTSFCLDTDVYDFSTKTLLASGSVHCVFVSWQTRRPLPVALKVWQQVKLIIPGERRPISGPDLPVPPASCLRFTQTRTVMPSDTDANNHLNEAMFIRFCFDCASSAALRGHLRSFSRDLLYADTKTVWFRYIQEARIGEEVLMCCWEDGHKTGTLWIEMRKESQVIGQCQIRLYEESLTKAACKPDQGQHFAKL